MYRTALILISVCSHIVKEFAVLAKKYVPNVVMTVVEKVMPEEKIAICQKICDELGVTLRIRPFEE